MSIPAELLPESTITKPEGIRIDMAINDFIENKSFRTLFENQYLGYENIGMNLFNQYNLSDLDLDIFRDFIVYVHENIISLPEYNYNTHTDAQILFITRVVYEILFIDFPNWLEDGTVDQTVDSDSLKHQLNDHYTKVFNIIKDLKPNSYEMLKYGYAIEIFDNDLTDLINNHIVKLNMVM